MNRKTSYPEDLATATNNAHTGEMAERIARKDWASTSMGHRDNWPNALRNYLSLILDNPFPMYIAWGSNLVQFYNDAYIHILGDKLHPEALGNSPDLTFSRSWDVVKPLFKSVLNGEVVSHPDYFDPAGNDGAGRHYNFSFSPLRDDDGSIQGVMAVAMDTSKDRALEKALNDANSQLNFAIQSAGLATFDYLPDTNMFRADKLLKTWFGLDENVAVDFRIGLDAVAKKDRNRVAEAIQSALAPGSDGLYDITYMLEPENGEPRMIHARGLASFEDGRAVKLSGVLFDISKEHKQEQKILESERRFRKSVEQAPMGVAIFRGKDYILEMGNDAYLQIVHKKLDEVLNRPLFEALPEVKAAVEPIFQGVMASGKSYTSPEEEITILRDGHPEQAFFNLVYHPLIDDSNLVMGIMVVGTEVTDTVITARKLKEREAHFRELVLRAPMPIAIFVGDDLVIDTANHAMLNTFWGRTLQQVQGKNLLDVFPELKGQKFPALLAQVLNTGETYQETEAKAVIDRPDGMSTYYVDLEYSPLFRENGDVYGVMACVNDMTAKLKARRKLEDAEERLRLATESTGLATWEQDLGDDSLIHSPRFADIMGFALDKQLSMSEVKEAIYPADREGMVAEAMKRAIRTGKLHYEVRILRRDGAMRWVRTQGKVYYDNDLEPSHMLGTMRDITREKAQSRALVKSEQRFRLLADTMPQFIWTATADGVLNYWNNSVFQYTGLSEAEMLGGKWIEVVHPDEREMNALTWTKSVNSGEEFLFEHRFRRHDGEYRWQLSRAVPQRKSDGTIHMWVGASTDIQTIKELDQQKDFFISMASHELKTPITSIKGYVQMMREMYAQSKDEFLINSLHTVDRQVGTLTNLITDLLDLSKISQGGLSLDFEQFDFMENAREIIAEIKKIYPTAQIEFSHGGSLMVNADQERISQVIINLLTNAIKYSGENAVVSVTAEKKGRSAYLAVKDQGIGIGKKDQRHIFERFYRVEGKNEKTFPGFGIGLNIVAEIIKRHSGMIDLESELGKGSTFYFTIPLER